LAAGNGYPDIALVYRFTSLDGAQVRSVEAGEHLHVTLNSSLIDSMESLADEVMSEQISRRCNSLLAQSVGY
jgi:hypothetical protein